MKQPLISIAMATYYGEKFLKEVNPLSWNKFSIEDGINQIISVYDYGDATVEMNIRACE